MPARLNLVIPPCVPAGSPILATASSSSTKGITAMPSAAADGAPASSRWFRFKQRRVQVRKVLQLQSRNFLADKMFDRLQRGQFLTAHECEGVAHILRPTGAPDAMHIIFRMLRHIVVDHVTHTGNIEPA